jgi:hypothetical protein
VQTPSYAPFSVTMDMRRVGEVTFTIWGKDRKDVMEFVKTHYRKQLRKVVSATSKPRTHETDLPLEVTNDVRA